MSIEKNLETDEIINKVIKYSKTLTKEVRTSGYTVVFNFFQKRLVLTDSPGRIYILICPCDMMYFYYVIYNIIINYIS